MAKKKVAKIKKKVKNIPNGVAHIHSTFNNTIVAITDAEGKVVSWKSGGTSGFKGTKKELHLQLKSQLSKQQILLWKME